MGEKRRILFVSHPTLQHIQPDKEGFYWNSFVSDTIKKVCERYQLGFYDAAKDLKVNSRNAPGQYYDSMGLHFNYKGLKVYSDFIAGRLVPMIEPLVKEANKN